MRILGIESSCDETGVAVYDHHHGLMAHALHSQVASHAKHGGVVPELASRDHVARLVPLVNDVLGQANTSLKELDGIAYTQGPGLIGALLTGACFAKSLANALDIPALGIHHLEAHMLVACLEEKALEFPYISLLVSGGHTQLIYVKGLGDYELLGETLDDAVGEAFDKTAKMMGIPYPGGPELARLADRCDVTPYRFPRPMIDRPGLDFSFSGLKTFALNTWQASKKTDQDRLFIARAFQDAVVDTLKIKCQRAVHQSECHRLVVAGGVGANRSLRSALSDWMRQVGGEVFYPKVDFCTDNGAMVAYAGYRRMILSHQDDQTEIMVRPRWPLMDLPNV